MERERERERERKSKNSYALCNSASHHLIRLLLSSSRKLCNGSTKNLLTTYLTAPPYHSKNLLGVFPKQQYFFFFYLLKDLTITGFFDNDDDSSSTESFIFLPTQGLRGSGKFGFLGVLGASFGVLRVTSSISPSPKAE